MLFLEGEPGLFLLEPGRVIAFPGNALAAIELEDPPRHIVKEIAVVGDEHNRSLILLQVPLEPRDAFGVEVIGRFVEEQEVGPLEQDFAQGDAPALATRECGDLGVARRQPHRIHGDLNAPVEVPPLPGLDGVLHTGLLFQERIHLIGIGTFSKLSVDFVEPRELGPHAGDGDLDIAAHVEGGVEHRLLRQVASSDAARGPCRADEVRVNAGHDPQERALARAVAADDADLVRRIERQPDVLENVFLTVGFRQLFDREDVLRRHVGGGSCRGRIRANRLLKVPGADRRREGRNRCKLACARLESQGRNLVGLRVRRKGPDAASRRVFPSFAFGRGSSAG